MQARLAHSANEHGVEQSVAAHLTGVSALARKLGEPLGLGDVAALAGVLHDLGKYGDLFQARLRNEAAHIDHWSLGAWAALVEHRSVAAALAVAGHHVGLGRGDKQSLGGLNPSRLCKQHPQRLRLSATGTDELWKHFESDGLARPSMTEAGTIGEHTGDMVDVRMLFSTLVDADFLDTEAHFQASSASENTLRAEGPRLDARAALAILERHVEQVRQRSWAAPSVNAMRDDLWLACLQGAELPPGIFTLSAPTGTGKTLAMLAFALKHALQNEMRRIVLAIPFLSIIEQTASILRSVFERDLGHDFVLEHHSLAGMGAETAQTDAEQAAQRATRALTENWDAPLIVTTNVQLLESLFSNRPSACRKLHRLARSVILFDEAQTLPVGLAVPTLAALDRMVRRFNATVVFATATQPAFEHFDPVLVARERASWRPIELVSPSLRLFERASRTSVEWPKADERRELAEVARSLVDEEQALCIVNLKRHAASLFELTQEAADGVLHLSTSLCASHRQQVLQEVRERLNRGARCILVSTQCVEAGVDVDFPVVYRAFGPLEAIAQAAGRCNRNGRLARGRVVVFVPSEECYPSVAYEHGASVLKLMLERCNATLGLDDPVVFQDYYRQFYGLARPETQREELTAAIANQDYPETARLYRLIEQDSVHVLVPWDASAFAKLRDEAHDRGISKGWMRRAQHHVVAVPRHVSSQSLATCLEPLPLWRTHQPSPDWFALTDVTAYDPFIGLRLNHDAGPWIV
ncbi:MAG: CRISPR-associated helicase Cas3' [Myxococcota bacterium]|jgi:CRISPR-associated helicase Cas3/CRISPR-associated endonuclease Cas3-HD|nr:CRISPR-associated helicase Cas3' [Myxococcota bacterium]